MRNMTVSEAGYTIARRYHPSSSGDTIGAVLRKACKDGKLEHTAVRSGNRTRRYVKYRDAIAYWKGYNRGKKK